ncbi:unnamed protein product [Symbiodinium natans]|uniref:Uncharacterized protein n=1 Tax=Symbiodinium natans TaxID=878477 RepID=A0A812SYU9_9DINO|nr:unnamed protein product [Symbiodinium natans]
MPTTSSSQELARQLRGHRRQYNNTQSPEDVVQMLLLAAPDAGRPPPEIVGAALKAAGLQTSDENLIRALQEAAGARGGNPRKEDLDRARAGAHEYQAIPRDLGGAAGSQVAGDKKIDRPMPEIKYNTPSTPAITFNNALAQMKKPVQAMRILEGMRLGMPDVATLPRMDGFDPASFLPPQTPEDVVRTLMQVVPDAGSPPPEVVGAALKAAGIPATDENVEKALKEALGSKPSSQDMAAARAAAAEYSTAGAGDGAVASDLNDLSKLGYPMFTEDLGSSRSSTAKAPGRGSQAQPEEVIKALLQAGPGLGQPPPEVVGLALRQAGVSVDEDVVTRALRAAGDKNPSVRSVRTALAAAQDDE